MPFSADFWQRKLKISGSRPAAMKILRENTTGDFCFIKINVVENHGTWQMRYLYFVK
jgi:hypothetical protein